MNEKKSVKQKKLKVYISRDDRAMLNEKRLDYKKHKRISDYHIDAA